MVSGIIAGLEGPGRATHPSYSMPPAFSDASRFARRVRHRYAVERDFLPPGLPQEAHLRRALEALLKTYPLASALRILRQLVMERLLSLDCDASLGLKAVMVCICGLAQFALAQAAHAAREELALSWGYPQTALGQEAHIWVVAMGKLGAKELNVSSDIDVVYVYEEDGHTSGAQHPAGAGVISNQEYVLKWVRKMQQLIAEVNEHGFVFRIDLALRPYGNASVSALPLSALERYFQQEARPWERFAWLKARVLSMHDEAHMRASKKLSALILPFVFRPYVDFSLLQSMREIHQQIQDQAQKDGLKHHGRMDIKLGRGGIREIEFGVQLLQLARVGIHPELRTRSTLKAIDFLQAAQLLANDEAEHLREAYVFLRRLEHRIQYLDDQQTHRLPLAEEDVQWLAACMGFGSPQAFDAALKAHQAWVQDHFDRLLAHPVVHESALNEPCAAPPMNTQALLPKAVPPNGNSQAALAWGSVPAKTPSRALASIVEGLEHGVPPEPLPLMWSKWLESLRLAKTTALTLERLGRVKAVLSRALLWQTQGVVQAEQVQAWLEWMEPLLKRDNYWVLFYENPSVHQQLMRLMGASPWSQAYLKAHPAVIDLWLKPHWTLERFDAANFASTMELRRSALARIEQDDEEQLLAVIRREHQAQMFRILAQDLMGYLTVQEVGDELSALADAVLRLCALWVWQRLNPTWLGELPLAVIGYGKLGSQELGYGSDLDLVLLYDDSSAVTQEQVTKMARQMIHWMTLKTAQGSLYDIDSALRPNGNAGLLVSAFGAFELYQRQLGANSAWTWEHQALTRARFCLGPQRLAQRFEALRQDVLCARRDPGVLVREVLAMRQKMWASLTLLPSVFDPKSSPGGMVDVEFVVQYLVLAHAQRYPELAQNIGNIALLLRAEALGLIPTPLGQEAAHAYRALRRRQHLAHLHDQPLRCDPADCQISIAAVKALWASQFEGLG